MQAEQLLHSQCLLGPQEPRVLQGRALLLAEDLHLHRHRSWQALRRQNRCHLQPRSGWTRVAGFEKLNSVFRKPWVVFSAKAKVASLTVQR